MSHAGLGLSPRLTFHQLAEMLQAGFIGCYQFIFNKWHQHFQRPCALADATEFLL